MKNVMKITINRGIYTKRMISGRRVNHTMGAIATKNKT
jgi:hypothetical protein